MCTAVGMVIGRVRKRRDCGWQRHILRTGDGHEATWIRTETDMGGWTRDGCREAREVGAPRGCFALCLFLWSVPSSSNSLPRFSLSDQFSSPRPSPEGFRINGVKRECMSEI